MREPPQDTNHRARRAAVLAALVALTAVAPPLQGAIPPGEHAALIDFYTNTGGDGWTNKTGWLGPEGTECGWFGVHCDAAGNTVTALVFSSPDNNVNGTLPASLGNLTSLEKLVISSYFSTGNLHGSLPSELGSLASLEILDLNHQQLTGSIPVSFGNLSSLRQLDLSYNQLTGGIPNGLGTLPNLEFLQLSVNQLTGPVPTSFNNLAAVKAIHLAANQLTGSIPDLSSLSNLRLLNLTGNQLSGTIPTWLGNLNLYGLELGNNHFTGSIPTEIGNCTSLNYLDLQHNHLAGGIPASFGNLVSLQHAFYLDGNMLSGAIPPSLVNLGLLGTTACRLRWNALYSNDAALTAFLDAHCWNCLNTQTVPPFNITVSQVTQTSFSLSWTPIPYTDNTGFYQFWGSLAQGGPYSILLGQTASKSDSSLTVPNLTPGTRYYGVMRTITQPHANNENTVTSEDSAEIEAQTLAEPVPTLGLVACLMLVVTLGLAGVQSLRKVLAA